MEAAHSSWAPKGTENSSYKVTVVRVGGGDLTMTRWGPTPPGRDPERNDVSDCITHSFSTNVYFFIKILWVTVVRCKLLISSNY